MGVITRNSWSRGWCSDADATNGPANALLRADNCVLDDLGSVVLRTGSAKVNASPLADLDVHSLYTVNVSGTRFRCVGAGSSVYVNSALALGGVNGSGDIAFGSMCGQVFLGRGTTRLKYDGTVRNWGISMSGTAPTLAALAADTKVLISCDSTESPAVTCEEGTPSFEADQAGTANGAVGLIPASTGRATMTKTFAAETDCATYSGGQVGTDNDLIEAYVYITDPATLKRLTIMVDCNGTPTNRFQDDYYTFSTQPGDTLDLSDIDFVEGDYTAQGRARRRIERVRNARSADDPDRVTEWRDDAPVANSGWNKVAIRRGMFRRVGGTTGKSWSTVKAVRFVFTMTGGGAGSAVRVDAVTMRGGAERPLTGSYKYRYVYVRNASSYLALSAPSAASTEIILKANGTTATAPADASRDAQINEIWLYRMGGEMDAYYRVAVQTGVTGVGAYAFNDVLSDRDAMIVNLRLETDNAMPPTSVIGIEGPYYDRLWVLTATTLSPSRRLDPDAFSTSQVITVGDATETAYWVAKGAGGLYVGTSKDIYLIEGTAAELPDETLDVIKRPLNIDHPPICSAVAKDGDLVVYLSSDGWRAISGGGAPKLPGHPDGLYRGLTRHGVSAVNLTGGTHRAAIGKGQVLAVTPEGASTTSSAVLYRAALGSGVWYRHTYPQAFRSIYREPDGTVVAGDAAGTVWTLDTGTADGATAIPVTMWTVQDDCGGPFQRKDPRDTRLLMDTGNVAMSAALHLDASATAAETLTVQQNGIGETISGLLTCPAFTRAQWRVTGSPSAFRWESVSYQWLDLPYPFRGRTAETNAGYPGAKVITGVTIRLCTRGVARIITPYFDGVAGPAFTVTTDTDEPTSHLQAFTATVTATDLSLSFDGDVEIYEWSPVVLYRLPLAVKVWDSGPLDLGVQDLVWLRGVRLKVWTAAAATFTITPYFDGQPWPAVTATVLANEPTFVEADCGRGYKGRTPRIVVTSATPFSIYWVELLRRSTSAQTDKKPIRFPAGVGGTTKA